jgi:predicted DNA-binding protein
MKGELVVNVSLRLSEAIRLKLEQLAKADQRTFAAYVRKIITDHVTKEEEAI